MRAAAAGSAAAAFRALFLTHLHSDHITDLNDIFTMRWAMTFAPNPLSVFGPDGTADLMKATEAMLESDIGYRLAHHNDLKWRPSSVVTEVDQGVIFDEDSVRVTAALTDHRPVVPSIAFRIDDGGKSVVIAGDTVPCVGLDELCSEADVLVHTVVRRDLIEQIGLPRLMDVLDYHSSVVEAAQTAARNGVRTLLLSHLVPAPSPGTEQEWIDLAADHFNGEILMASDLLTLDVTG